MSRTTHLETSGVGQRLGGSNHALGWWMIDEDVSSCSCCPMILSPSLSPHAVHYSLLQTTDLLLENEYFSKSVWSYPSRCAHLRYLSNALAMVGRWVVAYHLCTGSTVELS